MERIRMRGSITVFLSLSSVLFLSLICTTVESARVQGARAQTANITDMGNYSLFSEYEKKLLEDYEIFAVDGSYGTGDFAIERVNTRLQTYLSYNAEPKRETLAGLCFDPWNLQMDGSEITEYALLTDQGGEAFYQQAVSYMKATMITGSIGKLMQYYNDAQTAQDRQEEYEQQKNNSDREMKELEQQEQAKKKEQEELRRQQEEAAASRAEIVIVEEDPVETVKKENPLKAINKLRKKSILQIVCGSAQLSEKSVSKKELVFKRSLKKGSMKIKKENSGLTANLLFREYLLDRFPNYLDDGAEGKLEYQLEYILGGKRNDQANLKSTVQKLLLVREGLNYIYCVGNGEMSGQAGSLASLLIGWTGIPALVAIMKHALLLGWAYGESLMDVRTLLDGGKIPLQKTPETWMVTLDNLGRINELLEEGGKDRQEGISYKDYLRILLNLQFLSDQKKRALDLVELNLKSVSGLSSFQADHCIVGIREKTEWTVGPVFLRVPAVFLGTGKTVWNLKVDSGFAYN